MPFSPFLSILITPFIHFIPLTVSIHGIHSIEWNSNSFQSILSFNSCNPFFSFNSFFSFDSFNPFNSFNPLLRFVLSLFLLVPSIHSFATYHSIHSMYRIRSTYFMHVVHALVSCIPNISLVSYILCILYPVHFMYSIRLIPAHSIHKYSPTSSSHSLHVLIHAHFHSYSSTPVFDVFFFLPISFVRLIPFDELNSLFHSIHFTYFISPSDFTHFTHFIDLFTHVLHFTHITFDHSFRSPPFHQRLLSSIRFVIAFILLISFSRCAEIPFGSLTPFIFPFMPLFSLVSRVSCIPCVQIVSSVAFNPPLLSSIPSH